MKKIIVLGVLFLLPLVAYLFFASGVHNFAKLPILQKNVEGGIENFTAMNGDVVRLKNRITILGFLGKDLTNSEAMAFHLNQKIYKKNSGFQDFQFVMIVPFGVENQVASLLEELRTMVDISGWNFLFGAPKDIETFFNRLASNYTLDRNSGCPYVFIVDKDANLRGRDTNTSEDGIVKYGYDATSVAELSDEMNDDVKVILAEYRLALKKYKAVRKN